VSDRPHLRLSYVVARLDRALRVRIGAAVAPHGLTVAQYTVLSILRDRPGLSNAQLARRSYVTPQSMGQIIRALQEAGLIERRPDPGNQRTLRTAITAKGRHVLVKCDAAVAAMEAEMLSGLSGRARDELLPSLVSAVHSLGAGRLDF
jgi:DNA-binding MarR family transcriptional regulator